MALQSIPFVTCSFIQQFTGTLRYSILRYLTRSAILYCLSFFGLINAVAFARDLNQFRSIRKRSRMADVLGMSPMIFPNLPKDNCSSSSSIEPRGDAPRVALRSTLGFLMLPRWGVRGNAPRLGSLFAKTHKVFHYVDELVLVDELLQILRHQGFLLLLQLVKLAGWNRPLDPLRVLDAHRLRCLRD